jgi:hypothetical protein
MTEYDDDMKKLKTMLLIILGIALWFLFSCSVEKKSQRKVAYLLAHDKMDDVSYLYSAYQHYSYVNFYHTQNTPCRVVATPSFWSSVDKPSTHRASFVMPTRIDLTGQKFSRWIVIRYSHSRKNEGYYLCRCDCGAEKIVNARSLRTRTSKSCGCFLKDRFDNKEHYRYSKPEYAIWLSIKFRCYNSNATSYPDYGGRGIKVCERWLSSFDDFYNDMGPRPTNRHTIERIEVNGNYEPSNCKWDTYKAQANNRRSSVYMEHNGVRLTKAQWAGKIGITQSRMYYYTKTKNFGIQEILNHEKLRHNNTIDI